MAKTMKVINQVNESTISICRKLRDEITGMKDAIINEFRETRAAHEHLVRLALNEAEALAWQSGVPQLVFPTLAMEKVQAVATWEARQRSLHRSDAALPLAA